MQSTPGNELKDGGNVALIHPRNDFLIDPMVFPPLGLLYLAGSLQNSGIHVNIHDLNDPGTSIKDVQEADVYGITSTTPQWPNALETFRTLKQKYPDSTFVTGGVHPSLVPEDAAEFDAVVKGDGEIAIRKAVEGERGILNYPVDDMDSVPLPDREAIDLHKYRYLLNNEPTTTLITSRGCPYDCVFCSRAQTGVRLHSPQRVKQELEQIRDLGFGAVMIFDDIFMLKRDRYRKICRHLQDLGLRYRCLIRANLAKKEDLKLLAETGCVEVGCGFESSSQKILNNVDKRTTVQQQKELIQNCRNTGLRIKAFYIVGLPGETHETLRETAEFIKQNRCDDYDFSILVPLPGADLYQNPQNYDLDFNHTQTQTWYKGTPGQYSTPISTSSLSAKELVKWRDQLETRYKPKEKLKPRIAQT